jgi:hypothetical protein
MKRIIGFFIALGLTTSTFFASAEEFQHLDLNDNRTSTEYAGPIKALEKVIEGYKWLGQTPEMMGGVVFEAYDNPNFGKNDTESGSAIMVKAIFYTYDKVSKEEIMIARQSEISGFIELYGYNSRELQMHIRILDDNTFQSFANAELYRDTKNLFTYKKVQQFNKNPNKDKLKSASDSGMVF